MGKTSQLHNSILTKSSEPYNSILTKMTIRTNGGNEITADDTADSVFDTDSVIDSVIDDTTDIDGGIEIMYHIEILLAATYNVNFNFN